MSKTIRRKNSLYQDKWWVLSDHAFMSGHFRRVRIDPKSVEGRKRIAVFHSDHHSFMGGAPRWYCRIYSKKLTRFNKQQMQRWLGDAEFPVQCIANHRHSARWGWW